MRKPISIRLDQNVLAVARRRAKSVNRTLTNYIETLIMKDVAMSQVEMKNSDGSNQNAEVEISVFVAAPVTERVIVTPRDTDTPEIVEARQDILDIITGFKRA